MLRYNIFASRFQEKLYLCCPLHQYQDRKYRQMITSVKTPWVACEQSRMMLKMLGCLWLGDCYYVFIPLLKQLLTVAVILHFTCQNYWNDCPLIFLTNDCLIVCHLSGWNELLIASFSHRSIALKDGVLLASELQRDSAHSAGVGAIFDRYMYGDKKWLMPIMPW